MLCLAVKLPTASAGASILCAHLVLASESFALGSRCFCTFWHPPLYASHSVHKVGSALLVQALMVLVPEAYQNHPDLDAHYAGVKDFYRFYEGLQVRFHCLALLCRNFVRSMMQPDCWHCLLPAVSAAPAHLPSCYGQFESMYTQASPLVHCSMWPQSCSLSFKV